MREEILKLRAEGLSYKQIKEKTGCSLGTISYYCSPVQKEKTLQRQRDRRNKKVKFLQEYKQSNPCTDCGEFYPYYVMDFDHLHDKSFNIGLNIRHQSLDAVMIELEKCELVCSNCHRQRTHNRAVKSVGNHATYEQHLFGE